MLSFRLSALVALIAGNVSAFAPTTSLAGQRMITSKLAATAEAEVFFQNRVAEPLSVDSVGAGAGLLWRKFAGEPFVLQYRTSFIYDDKVETRPILDLSVLKGVSIDGKSLTVEAGVTVGKFATELLKTEDDEIKELFYGLPAIGSMSVVEAVLDGRFAKLEASVESVTAVGPDGKSTSKPLSEVDLSSDIVVSVTLTPQPREEGLVARWYSRKTPETLPDILIKDIPEDVKIIIHKHGVFNDVPNVVVFVDGGRDIGLDKDEWKEVLVETPQELWHLQNNLAELGGFDTLTETGILDTSKEYYPTLEEILQAFDIWEKNLLVWYEKGKIRVSYDAEQPPDEDDVVGEIFEFDSTIARKVSIATKKIEYSDRKSDLECSVYGGTQIPDFEGEVFDGVRGQMQEKRFQYATSSYDNMMNPAMVAYPTSEADVCAAIKFARADYPDDKNPRKTQAHPSGRKYKVMGRGGGHQYCGVSCDNGNMILSMEKLNKLEAIRFDEPKTFTGPDGKPREVKVELRVGTGHKLRQFATWNNQGGVTDGEPALGSNNINGWTIPHGECPTVGIGGHSQSGGYGHTARAFGLAIDYIHGFNIVLADGTLKENVNRDHEDPDMRDLYWAVMGGSPGAFGVTTELIIHPILDEDYPNSSGYSRTVMHSDEKMLETMKILEDFINRSKAGDENAICEEIDLMVSLSSNNGNRLRNNPYLDPSKDSIIPNLDIILFELECRDTSNPKANEQYQEIIKAFEKNVEAEKGLLENIRERLSVRKLDGTRHNKLSEMSFNFVRSPPAVINGRENRKPYKKMCYGSKDKLKPGWSTSFANLLNDTVRAKSEDISCIMQVVVGGGAQASNGVYADTGETFNAIAHRDAQLHGLVFDLFRGETDESIMKADELTKRFEVETVNCYQTAHPKVMAQWASHGDLDMNKKEVWEKYYDKEETYRKLRRIKKKFDPEDVFHSRFTIRPED